MIFFYRRLYQCEATSINVYECACVRMYVCGLHKQIKCQRKLCHFFLSFSFFFCFFCLVEVCVFSHLFPVRSEESNCGFFSPAQVTHTHTHTHRMGERERERISKRETHSTHTHTHTWTTRRTYVGRHKVRELAHSLTHVDGWSALVRTYSHTHSLAHLHITSCAPDVVCFFFKCVCVCVCVVDYLQLCVTECQNA